MYVCMQVCMYVSVCVCVCIKYIYIYIFLVMPCPKFTSSFLIKLCSEHPNIPLLGYVLNFVICSSLQLHLTPPHTQYFSSGGVISPTQRPTTHNTHKRQTSMPLRDPNKRAAEAHALERAAIGLGYSSFKSTLFIFQFLGQLNVSCFEVQIYSSVNHITKFPNMP